MGLLAQDDPSLLDNEVLDEFRIPFGDWMDQAVDWIATELDTALDIIVWPFDVLIDFLVRGVLEEVSWVFVVLAMGLIAALVRNIRVAVFVMVALTVCGLLGNAYWVETARTIGFIGVAVFFCVLIGIPLGVLAGRFDGVWQTIRPVLDAMQVVHSFVYMLPVIFFWGIGEVSATMVTMVFAIPPLIRLTNLGIRQVPEDVVEASRAYGASEIRVLTDVQLPLARPAIMTGINQTLLLAISMLGIAAIMGAGGLGRLMFRALSNQDVSLAASSGLAFFLVAVVLDRISQREDGDGGSLLSRIAAAWAHRRDPEALLADEADTDADAAADTAPTPAVRFAEVSSGERTAGIVTGVGSLVAIVALVLPWTIDAGKFSAFGRRADESLNGDSFNGLSASGGSWFGFIILALAAFTLLAVFTGLGRPGRGARWLAADGAAIASISVFVLALVHLISSAAPNSEPGTGIGVYLAVAGGALATAGSIWWMIQGPYSALRPLSPNISWARYGLVVFAALVLLGAAFSGWSFDGRTDVVLSPEIEAQIAELRQQAEDEPDRAGPIAAELSSLMASARSSDTIVTDGLSSDGSRLGLWTLLIGALALAAALPAVGALGRDEHRQWMWSTINAGIGASIMMVTSAWVMTQVRTADPNYVSGIGSFLALVGGFVIVASSMGVLSEFRRSRVYEDIAVDEPAEQSSPDVELVGAPG
ncbi:MAG: ABC transporter permease subunit [Actinomycetota bacterium]